MRVELRTRDGELLGNLDLQVNPLVAQQALMHTQVVLGDTVDDEAPVTAVAASESAKAPKTRRRSKAKGA